MEPDRDPVSKNTSQKHIKQTILFASVLTCIFSVFVLSAGLIWWLGFNIPPAKYINVNDEALVKEIEDVYLITFPQKISNVKAAKSHLDDWSSQAVIPFIITFELSSVEPLLNMKTVSDIANYEVQDDERFNGFRNYPDWFTIPISEGKIFTINANRKSVNSWCYIRVYIDTSNDDKAVVYMSGGLDVN